MATYGKKLEYWPKFSGSGFEEERKISKLLVFVVMLITMTIQLANAAPHVYVLSGGWESHFPNSEGLGDKGGRIPVTTDVLSTISAVADGGEPIGFKWFFQREEPAGTNVKPYESVVFKVWLQRFEGEEMVAEEWVGRWLSPIGYFIDLNQEKTVQWSPGFEDQVAELGITVNHNDALKAEVKTALNDQGVLRLMFFGRNADALDFVEIPQNLEFPPGVEFQFVLLRKYPGGQSRESLLRTEERIRRFLRTLSPEQLGQVEIMNPMSFNHLGEPGVSLAAMIKDSRRREQLVLKEIRAKNRKRLFGVSPSL